MRLIITIMIIVLFCSGCISIKTNTTSETHKFKKNQMISMIQEEQEILARMQEEFESYKKLHIDINHDGEVKIYNSDEISMYYFEKHSFSCWDDIEYLIIEYELSSIGYGEDFFYLSTRFDDAEHQIILSQDKFYEEDNNYENVEGDWYYSFFGFV